MSESPTLLYLETDDEITAVVRRVRAADPGRVVVVAPGRSRATSSVVALRLLARAAASDDREIAVVGDALTRSLAAEAGIAAFATVDEARHGEAPSEPVASASSHAAIHIVRGPAATEDSAPTLAAAAVAADAIGSDDVTRPVPVAAPRRRPEPAARVAPRAGGLLPVAGIAALILLVAGVVVAGAVLLPAASVTIVPRTGQVGPLEYSVVMTEPERMTGTAEATATVTATETYEINEAATGGVVFFNFNFFDVEVPAGSLVATGAEAGDQAFATAEAVVVPAGTFDPLFGGITAGEAGAAVTAAATGEGGNVAAGTIDTVLDQGLAGQLRGFPSITETLVTNPEAMSGGVAASGPEITQADVDAAVAALADQLTAEVAAAAPSDDESIVVHIGAEEPTYTGIDGLVGTRDQATVEISGSLAWEALRVERSATEDAAIAQLPTEATGAAEVPPGHEVLPGSEAVQFVNARAVGDAIEVDVSVTASSAAVIDTEGVAGRIAGMTPDEAQAELADIGDVTIELWPAWVTEVPTMEGRIEVEVAEPGPAPSATPDESP